jgi:hypothetical protein
MSQLNVTSLKHEGASGDNITLSSNGSVGVGVSSPAVPLDVSGYARASSGILFGTDTAAANALDDYEEGTWTPNIQNSGSSSTFTIKTGRYTKIGRFVYCSFLCDGGNSGTAGGALTLLGLPFSYGGTNNVPTLVSFTANNLGNDNALTSRTANGSTSFVILDISDGNNATAQVGFAAGTVIYEV